jgi:predicted AAA+ superfamily ATPase
MIERLLESNINSKISTGKAIIIIGARQTGKTSFVEKKFSSNDVLWLDADEPDVRKCLTT